MKTPTPNRAGTNSTFSSFSTVSTVSTKAALAVVLCLGASGCFWVTTKNEGTQIKKQVQDVDVRVKNMEGALESKLKKLQIVLDQATKILKRNSANLGADVDAMRAELRKMRGLLTAAKKFSDDARADVAKLNKAFGAKLEVVTSRINSVDLRLQGLEKSAANPPKKASDYYRDGLTAFNKGKWDEAITAFKNVVIRFPHHSRADDAQFYRAESHMRAKRYSKAVREYQKVFDKFATSKWADDALYQAATAAQKQKQCRVARVYLLLLRKKYKKSAFRKRARIKDRALKRNLRNRRICVK